MRRRVLVVDDDAMNREIMEAYLQIEGYEVLLASDGESAVELARVQHPDLIITDVRMPDMDGFTLCAQLKADAELCNVPVIVLSGLSSEEDSARALAAGARAFVSRPFEHKALFALIEALVEA